MKRICSLILIFALICAYKIPFKPLFKSAEGYYTLTVGEGTLGRFYTVKAEKIDCFRGIFNVSGQSLKTENKEYIDNFLRDYSCVQIKTETVDGLTIRYYYSSKIPVYRSINGKKVNVQTCFGKDYYVIGSPLIYCGF